MKTYKETSKYKSPALHFIHCDKCYRVFKIVYDGKREIYKITAKRERNKLCK